MFKDFSLLERAGFTGFKSVNELWLDFTSIPNERGIYVVLNPDCSKSTFLAKGSGGFFKGKDPNVCLTDLSSKWVNDCHVIYIGKAGGDGSSATLRKRLNQYLNFGKGKAVGHYGGRFIWQLAHHPELIIAWKVLKEADPRMEEKNLIKDFESQYGQLPFANLMR